MHSRDFLGAAWTAAVAPTTACEDASARASGAQVGRDFEHMKHLSARVSNDRASIAIVPSRLWEMLG